LARRCQAFANSTGTRPRLFGGLLFTNANQIRPRASKATIPMNETLRTEEAPALRAIGTTLTREHYVSREIFDKEIEKIFFKQWFCAGHVCQIPNVGDYFLHSFAGENLIILRESADEIRAHFNVCRHRGSQLTKAEKGNVKLLVCPYHQWSYELSGRLKRAPMMPNHSECVDYSKLGLKSATVEVYGGLIFVNFSPQPAQRLSDEFGVPGETFKRLEPEKLKELCRTRLSVKANWKTLLENYLECYHCAVSHPDLGVAFDIQASMQQTADWGGGGACFVGGEPLRKGFATVSKNGELVSKPLGRFADDVTVQREVAEGLGLLPVLTRVLFHLDYANVHMMNPISVDEVEWTTVWYVRADAVEGVDYDADRVTEVWRATNAQDKELCERNYRGVVSRNFVPGPLNPKAEGAIRHALDYYLELMA
jgi:phenylpropionate dioxygenase-like ring-hydroxylating dioxygenase large terminal subunit